VRSNNVSADPALIGRLIDARFALLDDACDGELSVFSSKVVQCEKGM
jgi:hypothetical protein